MNTLVGHPLWGWLSRKRTALGTSTENFVRALGGGAVLALLVQWGGSARRMPLTRSGDHEGVDIVTVPRPPSINDVVLQPVSRDAGGSAIGSVSPLSSGNQHIPSNPEHHQHRCQHSMHCA